MNNLYSTFIPNTGLFSGMAPTFKTQDFCEVFDITEFEANKKAPVLMFDCLVVGKPDEDDDCRDDMIKVFQSMPKTDKGPQLANLLLSFIEIKYDDGSYNMSTLDEHQDLPPHVIEGFTFMRDVVITLLTSFICGGFNDQNKMENVAINTVFRTSNFFKSVKWGKTKKVTEVTNSGDYWLDFMRELGYKGPSINQFFTAIKNFSPPSMIKISKHRVDTRNDNDSVEIELANPILVRYSTMLSAEGRTMYVITQDDEISIRNNLSKIWTGCGKWMRMFVNTNEGAMTRATLNGFLPCDRNPHGIAGISKLKITYKSSNDFVTVSGFQRCSTGWDDNYLATCSTILAKDYF